MNTSTSYPENLPSLLRSGEMQEVMEEMSPDDRARLFEEPPAKVVRQPLDQLSPERKVTAELLGYEVETAGRLMTTEYIAQENQTALEARNRPSSRPRH